jgi:pyruvate-formate lyase
MWGNVSGVAPFYARLLARRDNKITKVESVQSKYNSTLKVQTQLHVSAEKYTHYGADYNNKKKLFTFVCV